MPLLLLNGSRPNGMPLPRQKGKSAIIVIACTTPWPFNFLLPESRGAVRAVREVPHYGGYRVRGVLVRPGTKQNSEIPASLLVKARAMGTTL